MSVHVGCKGKQMNAMEGTNEAAKSTRLHIEHTYVDKTIQTRTFLLDITCPILT